MPVWWNARRDGLKIRRWRHRVGSSPTTGTTSSRTAYRSRRRFLFQSKRHLSLIPSFLLSDRDSLRWIRGRCLAGDEIKISESVLFFARNLDIRRLPSFDRGKVDFPKSSDRTRDIFIPGRHMNMTFRYNVSCNALQMLWINALNIRELWLMQTHLRSLTIRGYSW